jgi:hypothetical protein
MASACEDCGKGLGFTERARGRSRCGACMELARVEADRLLAAARAAGQQAMAAYPAALEAIAAGRPPSQPIADLERAIVQGGGQPAAAKTEFLNSYLRRALADEVLSGDEEEGIVKLGMALYEGNRAALAAAMEPYRAQLFIAMVNDGRLPVLPGSGMILKKGEVLHLDEPQGVSFRIAKGVSYRVGATRGRMVEVGRSIVAADAGALHVTSHRVVYTGERKSIEVQYAKLVDMNVYTDGIQFHVSNRQNPSMFRVASGPMVAAVVNAASQKLL